jgi:Domain of unknown function (DUF4062)
VAVPAVFVSSVQRGCESVRDAARDTLLSLRMHPIMAEITGASPASPQRALLDEVAQSDYFLLILGSRYGDPGPAGTSPTEDEFNEARRVGKPIIVLVQEGDQEPAQHGFLERIRSGGWEKGILYGTFGGPDHVGPAIVAAFAKLTESSSSEDPEGARTHAAEMVQAAIGRGSYSSGVVARIAIVPTSVTVLLDALSLESPTVADEVASRARQHGLVAQEVGLKSDVSSEGITLRGATSWEGVELLLQVLADGGIFAQTSVRGVGSFAGSIVEPDRLRAFVQGVGDFAQAVWDHIDRRQEIRRAAVQIAIPDSEFMGYGQNPGNSMSLGGRMPATVQAPMPPDVVNRGELATPETARRLVAAVRRVFADAGRVYE